ncbi:methyltransferase [Streptomyces sp. NPDC047973]|uniref:class I SAM-dependent methyltransferase n=1 Tax=Streptomyces sp. NPDC047973 TaxID=3155383 RepID=UPI00342056FA
MSNSSAEIDVLSYFRGKADRYDEVDQQVYWRLSDTLLWETLSGKSLDSFEPGFSFLDAGGGTGRWATRVLDSYPQARGWLVDLSEDMLAVAEGKRTGDRAGRFTTVRGDLEKLPDEITGQRFDVIFNFHNVIGFLGDPLEALRGLAALLNPGGHLITLAPSLYHSTYFNLANGRFDEAERAVREQRATFTEGMPPLRLFTPHQLTGMYEEIGCPVEVLTGFPSVIYPTFQETQIEGTGQSVEKILGTPEGFQRVLDIERCLVDAPDVAARGNNIFVVGRKR